MKVVTTAASRGERTARCLRDLVEIAGEDVAHAVVDAALENSERPLMCLPDKWRYKAIAAFRWTIRK